MTDVQAEETELDDVRIVRALEEDIIFGRLAPGARLTEDSLLSRFPVTRHFVRQALVQLEQMGIVVRERNKGATVRSLNPSEVDQIYAVRELVQRQAALLIPLPAPQALIDDLLKIHDEHGGISRAAICAACTRPMTAFTSSCSGPAGTSNLVQTIELYMRYSLPVRANSMADRVSLEIAHSQHKLMIDMLSGRDNWVLAQLCVDHLQPSKRRYINLVGH